MSAKELQIIRQIHETPGGFIKNARESGALAENVVWHVPGPPDILPFAGTFEGAEGIARFESLLSTTVRYDRAELVQYLTGDDCVAAIFIGEGIAIATGREFKGHIVRLYRFQNGKIVEVRNCYDTACYVDAVTGPRR